MKAEYRSILCLDFDGVLHSYKSGWKGATIIPDPPVPGAIKFLLEAGKYFHICILSSRSHKFGGRRAMRKWLTGHVAEYLYNDLWETAIRHEGPYYEMAIGELNRMQKDAALIIAEIISFPKHKPAAFVTIDDRAIQFTGNWPSITVLKEFKPWNKV